MGLWVVQPPVRHATAHNHCLLYSAGSRQARIPPCPADRAVCPHERRTRVRVQTLRGGRLGVHRRYRGAKIQLLDLPGIIEGAKDGKGRGRQVRCLSLPGHLHTFMAVRRSKRHAEAWRAASIDPMNDSELCVASVRCGVSSMSSCVCCACQRSPPLASTPVPVCATRPLQVISTARTCNLIIIVLDCLKPITHKKLIEHELEGGWQPYRCCLLNRVTCLPCPHVPVLPVRAAKPLAVESSRSIVLGQRATFLATAGRCRPRAGACRLWHPAEQEASGDHVP